MGLFTAIAQWLSQRVIVNLAEGWMEWKDESRQEWQKFIEVTSTECPRTWKEDLSIRWAPEAEPTTLRPSGKKWGFSNSIIRTRVEVCLVWVGIHVQIRGMLWSDMNFTNVVAILWKRIGLKSPRAWRHGGGWASFEADRTGMVTEAVEKESQEWRDIRSKML